MDTGFICFFKYLREEALPRLIDDFSDNVIRSHEDYIFKVNTLIGNIINNEEYDEDFLNDFISGENSSKIVCNDMGNDTESVTNEYLVDKIIDRCYKDFIEISRRKFKNNRNIDRIIDFNTKKILEEHKFIFLLIFDEYEDYLHESCSMLRKILIEKGFINIEENEIENEDEELSNDIIKINNSLKCTYIEMEKFASFKGFKIDRQNNTSHRIWKNKNGKSIVIPNKKDDNIPIGTLTSILKSISSSRQEFLNYLLP